MTKKLKIILGLIILAIAYVAFAWIVFVFAETPRYDHANWPEKQWVVERHKYHGITVSIEENGKHYFYDKRGRKCKL